MKKAGIAPRAKSNVADHALALRNRFDQELPPVGLSDMDDMRVLVDSCVGWCYSDFTGTCSGYEHDEYLLEQYSTLRAEHEERQEAKDTRGQVLRRLRSLSPVAATKFDAAWDGYHGRMPLLDQTSGPALEMRSAVHLTIRKLLAGVPRPAGTLTRKGQLPHIAAYAARSEEMRIVLEKLGTEYEELMDAFSAYKDKADPDRGRLRALLYRATQLLHNVLGAIDYGRLTL